MQFFFVQVHGQIFFVQVYGQILFTVRRGPSDREQNLLADIYPPAYLCTWQEYATLRNQILQSQLNFSARV